MGDSSDSVRRTLRRRATGDSESSSENDIRPKKKMKRSKRPAKRKTIPVCTNETATSDTDLKEICPICLIPFDNQEIATPESCEHMFCVECLQGWSRMMNTCPMDRQEYGVILVRRNINERIYKKIPVKTPNP